MWAMMIVLLATATVGASGPVTLESFEEPKQLQLGGMQIQPASRLLLSEAQPFEGKRCAELRYRFERVKGLQYLEVIAPHKLSEKPRRFSVAVRGDSSFNIVRARFVDAGGEWHQYDLGVLHFRGWRILWTHLDTPHGCWGGDGNGRLDFPVTFFSIVLDSLERPSEGVVAFDAVTAHYGEEERAHVNAKFVPDKLWGYFWGKDDPPSGKLVVTATGEKTESVEVAVYLLNHKEERMSKVWHGNVTVSPNKPFERPLQLRLNRFGVHFVEVQVGGSEVHRQSICWLPNVAPIWDGSPFGVCTHFGQFKHKLPETMELIRKMGAGWIRDELYWSNVEREKEKFTFPDYYDAYMKTASKFGIKPLIIFNYANRHYDGGLAPHTEEGRKGFVRYCLELIQRYRAICNHWEVWNEPNIGFWKPKPNAEDYSLLLQAVYKEVKSVEPKATIVGICTAGTDLSFIEDVLKRGGKFMDAISVHPYRAPRSPEASDFVGEMRKLKELLDKYNLAHLNVWLTEFGYPTHVTGGLPQWLSAAYIVRTCLLALTLPFIERFFVYDFQDDGEDATYNEHNFGLIRFDGSPKVGYAAFNTMVRMLAGRKFSRHVDVGEGAICLVFEGDGDEMLVLWATHGERKVNLKTTSKALTLIDLMGNGETIHPVSGNISLTLGPEPIFILTNHLK